VRIVCVSPAWGQWTSGASGSIYYSGGNVAIGNNSNPQETLDVYGQTYTGTGNFFLTRFQPSVTSAASQEIAGYYNPGFTGSGGVVLGI